MQLSEWKAGWPVTTKFGGLRLSQGPEDSAVLPLERNDMWAWKQRGGIGAGGRALNCFWEEAWWRPSCLSEDDTPVELNPPLGTRTSHSLRGGRLEYA
ncbi:unnamed protein product [Caretta caretta]